MRRWSRRRRRVRSIKRPAFLFLQVGPEPAVLAGRESGLAVSDGACCAWGSVRGRRSGPWDDCNETSSPIAAKTAVAARPNRRRPFGRPTAAAIASGNGGTRPRPAGSNAIRSPAMASSGRAGAGSPGNAAIIRERRWVAAGSDIRDSAIASRQGSRSDRASADMTLSACPCLSWPIEAYRNGSKSRPMLGARAGWAMSSANSICASARSKANEGRGRRLLTLSAERPAGQVRKLPMQRRLVFGARRWRRIRGERRLHGIT